MKTDFILLDEAKNYSNHADYPFGEEIYKIIGACMEVHSILGRGFLEIVYKDALEYEFKLRGIPYVRGKNLKFPIRISFYLIASLQITSFSMK